MGLEGILDIKNRPHARIGMNREGTGRSIEYGAAERIKCDERSDLTREPEGSPGGPEISSAGGNK